MDASVLKPSLLVALRTSVRGGIDYERIDIEPEHEVEAGARQARWETTRRIANPEECERATQVRSQARALIAGACVRSSFGLLCPMEREQILAEAIRAARARAAEHNESARVTRIEVNILVGRIAQDDVEAARAISAEVRSLLDAVRAGIDTMDVAKVREAATRAKALGGMLSEGSAQKVRAAVEEARAIARRIAKQVEVAGDDAAAMVGDIQVRAIEEARFAFLDIDDEGQPERGAGPGMGALLDLQLEVA